MELIRISSGLGMIFDVGLFSALPEQVPGVAVAAAAQAGISVPIGGKKDLVVLVTSIVLSFMNN